MKPKRFAGGKFAELINEKSLLMFYVNEKSYYYFPLIVNEYWKSSFLYEKF